MAYVWIVSTYDSVKDEDEVVAVFDSGAKASQLITDLMDDFDAVYSNRWPVT